MSKKFGERVRARRAELGLTQKQLAEKFKRGDSYVSKIEAGFIPSAASLQALARALDVNEEWLESGKGDPARPSTRYVLEEHVMVRNWADMPMEIRAQHSSHLTKLTDSMLMSGAAKEISLQVKDGHLVMLISKPPEPIDNLSAKQTDTTDETVE